MPKVTVLIPSLNVGSYIEECLGSVVRQTLSDIEILCIDAGSTDGTKECLEKFAANDSRIRLLSSEIKSYGYQMNLGLSAATGEYISIVESDDFIEPEMLQTLYDEARREDDDFVKCDFYTFAKAPSGERLTLPYSLKRMRGVSYETAYRAEDYRKRVLPVDVFIWNGLYRRSFLKEHKVQFQETPGAAFQDIGFRYQVAFHAKKAWYLPTPLYHYRRDNAGASTYRADAVCNNLEECLFTYEKIRALPVARTEWASFYAEETAFYFLTSLHELLRWKDYAPETASAFERYRDFFRERLSDGTLQPDRLPLSIWTELSLFLREPGLFDAYARAKAAAEMELYRDFLTKATHFDGVIIYGAGIRGEAGSVLLRLNGITVDGFCDSAEKKVGSVLQGKMVYAPEEAAVRFPKHGFLISTERFAEEASERLAVLGIPKGNHLVYRLQSSPIMVTNLGFRGEI